MELEAGTGGFSESQRRAIAQVGQACASLSFVGSAVIVVANFRFKQLRTYSFQLVVWLAVCDIGINLSFFLGSPTDGSGLCYTQAIVQQFFQVALMQWTLLTSQSLLVVASKTRAFDGNKRMPWNHLWAWGVSAVLTIGPLCTRSLGGTETSVCWIKSNHSWDVGTLWRGLFLLVVFLSMVSIVWTYVSVVNHLGRAQRSIVLLSCHSISPSGTTNHNEDGNNNNDQSPARPITTTTENTRDSPAAPTDAKPRATTAKPNPPPRVLLATPAPRKSDGKKLDETAFVSKPGLGQGQYSKSQTPHKKNLLSRLGSSCSGKDGCAGARGCVVADDCCGVGRGATGFVVDEVFVRGLHDRSLSEGHRSVEGSRSSSLFSRSNSQVCSRDWLWSTSRELGFMVEKEAIFERGDGGDREISLSLNSLDIAHTGSPERISPPEPLPTLPEAELGVVAAVAATGETGKDNAVRGNNSIVPQPTPWANTLRKATRAKASTLSTASLCADESASNHAVIASGGDADGIRTESRVNRNGNGDVTGPAAAAVSAKPGDKTGNYPTPQRPMRSRIVDGAGKARGFVRRMSSLDVENLTGNGRVASGCDEVFSVSVGSVAGQRVTGPRCAANGEWDGSGRSRGKARAGDMEKFISRVKWYPVIYVLCWVFTLINGIGIIAVGPVNASLSLVLLATITARLQGLLNFLWYGLNDNLKQAWLQDFLYRRAVASCCRALWCCCLCPCLPVPRNEDDTDITRFGEDELKHSARVSAAEKMEDGVGASSMRTTSFPAPANSTPARSTTDVVPFSTPSAPREAFFVAPMRPARPCRKTLGNPYSTGDSAMSMESRRNSEGSIRRMEDKNEPNAWTASNAAASDRRRRDSDIAPKGHPPANGVALGKHKAALSPALPISVSMPVGAMVSGGSAEEGANGSPVSASSWFFFDSDSCSSPSESNDSFGSETDRGD